MEKKIEKLFIVISEDLQNLDHSIDNMKKGMEQIDKDVQKAYDEINNMEIEIE